MNNYEETDQPTPEIAKALQEMQGGFGDWSILGFFDETGQARADYAWYKKCESMSLDQLQALVDDGALGKDETGELIVADDDMDASIVAFYEKRHNQAVVVLEARGGK